MNKKGFTLIELLAVIIILAVIALIATPIVLNTVEKAKKEANKNSARGVFDSARLFHITALLEGHTSIAFKCNGESCSSDENKLSFTGKVPNDGNIYVLPDGNISGWVEYDGQIYSYDNDQIVEGYINDDTDQIVKGYINNDNVLYSWSKEYFTGTLKNELLS